MSLLLLLLLNTVFILLLNFSFKKYYWCVLIPHFVSISVKFSDFSHSYFPIFWEIFYTLFSLLLTLKSTVTTTHKAHRIKNTHLREINTHTSINYYQSETIVRSRMLLVSHGKFIPLFPESDFQMGPPTLTAHWSRRKFPKILKFSCVLFQV